MNPDTGRFLTSDPHPGTAFNPFRFKTSFLVTPAFIEALGFGTNLVVIDKQTGLFNVNMEVTRYDCY